MSKGKYIVLEGADGVGKTTMSTRLRDWLSNNGNYAIYTRHPGSAGKFGEEVRRLTKEYQVDPITEALLFAVDNSAFTAQILKPNIADGTCVIADRSNFISSLAYQIASGCSLSELDRIHDAIPDPPKMDLLIILRASADTIKDRVKSRGDQQKDDRFEYLMSKDPTYFQKVTNAYDTMLDNTSKDFVRRMSKFVKLTTTTPYPVPRCIGIDANKDPDSVFSDICDTVEPLFE